MFRGLSRPKGDPGPLPIFQDFFLLLSNHTRVLCSLQKCIYLRFIKGNDEDCDHIYNLFPFGFQIESESNKKTIANLEKISADYKEMKHENATLLAKVKGK